jgi:hypothetical protein
MRTYQTPSKHREAMARVGLLYSVNALQIFGSEAGCWDTVPFGSLQHHILHDQVKVPSFKQWAPVPGYLKLPADVLECAVSISQSVSKHAPNVAPVAPIRHGQEVRQPSPLEKSIVCALHRELKVPIIQEAVPEGSYVALDVAIVSKSKQKHSAVFVALAVQGPHHFVCKLAKEFRSSGVKQLLCQRAGWHVVALNFKDWKGSGLRSRRNFLRQKLVVLPHHCCKAEEVT